MNKAGAWIKNIALTAASVLLVLLLSIVADRLLGKAAAPPTLPGTMELIFPPNAEQAYESVDFKYTAHINSIGLRDRELPKERGNTYRILAIGDSYTYGWGVEIEQCWLRLLEERLRKDGFDVETVNAGKPGWGPQDYAQFAERALPILRPNLVIVGILEGNDLAASGPTGLEKAKDTLLDKVRVVYPNIVRVIRDLAPKKDLAQRTQEMPPQKSTAEDNRRWTANTAKEFLGKMTPEQRARFEAFDDKVKEAFLNGNLNPYMLDLANQNPKFYNITMNLDDAWTKTCIERMGGHLRRVKKCAATYGAQVAVFSIPDGPYVNLAANKNIRRVGYEVQEDLIASDAPDKAIARACEQADVPFLQATGEFKNRKDDPGLFFELDGHLSPAGHQLYAEAIAPSLEKLLRQYQGK